MKFNKKLIDELLNKKTETFNIFNEAEEIDFEKDGPIHDTLNPVIWKDFSLQKDVKEKLHLIAETFITYVGLPIENVHDVVFTGSNANYNYHEGSDIDIHVEYSIDMGEQCTILDDFFRAKKTLWNNSHEINIHGFPIELYAEDINSTDKNILVKNSGIYSIWHDAWLVKPEKESIPQFDEKAIQSKFDSFVDQIDYIVNTGVQELPVIEKLKENIRHLRATGLAKGGEFSTNNLVFKELRNYGYLDKLSQYVDSLSEVELGLE